MCQTCGCGDPQIIPVDVHERILAGNDRTARHNREHFEEHRVLAVNLMGSPGSGKTAVLEATARALGGTLRLGAISGDLATDRDATRLRAAGVPSITITTGSACHLDAEMVQLMPIGIGRKRKTARRRQADLHQPGEICRFRPDPFRIGSRRIVQVKNEGCHRDR